MKINKTYKNGILTIEVDGRLDTTTASELEQSIGELDNVTDLVFDFKNLEYISSAGLRIILKAQKIMNAKGCMKLINVNDSVNEVFDITGFSDILTVE